uniref:Uncharacterized protein n=1 Tax=Bubo bubo TaxID=30461 RepID=A0A8C0F1T0_BUBBB
LPGERSPLCAVKSENGGGKNGEKIGKILPVAEGVGVACLLLYPKPECRPSRSQKAAQPGISVVREGIMMSHPLAKVHAERMGGAHQGDFQTWQCLFEIQAEVDILKDL